MTSCGPTLLRSFSNLLDVERGFDTTNIVAIDINLPGARYSTDVPILAFYDRLLSELRALPGVERGDAVSALLHLAAEQLDVDYRGRQGTAGSRGEPAGHV